MLYYPQISTGSVAQYPIQRSNARRTIVNTFYDGTQIAMSDDGAAMVGWQLTYAHLTLDEVNALEAFFQATSGRLQTFTFLDPTDNLLNYSEDLSQPSWQNDPLINIAAGVGDPLGGSNASTLTNNAQASQQVAQAIAGPGGFQYCLSLYLRSNQPASVQLLATSTQGSSSATVKVVSAWTKASLPVQFGGQSDGLTVGLQLAAGSQVSVFGWQLEAQVAAGAYKKTRNQAGVYPNARFDQDAFTAVATGINQYSASVKITCNTAG